MKTPITYLNLDLMDPTTLVALEGGLTQFLSADLGSLVGTMTGNSGLGTVISGITGLAGKVTSAISDPIGTITDFAIDKVTAPFKAVAKPFQMAGDIISGDKSFGDVIKENVNPFGIFGDPNPVDGAASPVATDDHSAAMAALKERMKGG